MRNETKTSMRGSIMDWTTIDMCAFEGGSTKLETTPGGGGQEGVVVGSILAKSMADIANDYVDCVEKFQTRQS